jgi:hypothetical protein
LVFWSLILWGTLYSALLLHVISVEGPSVAFQRALSGRDMVGGVLNLALAGGAVVVWGIVALLLWRGRLAAHRRRRVK